MYVPASLRLLPQVACFASCKRLSHATCFAQGQEAGHKTRDVARERRLSEEKEVSAKLEGVVVAERNRVQSE